MWRFKNKRVQFIQIDVAYTDYLRKHIDLRIPAEHRESVSEMRPFIGILMTHDDIEYVIPLTSPKDKHKQNLHKYLYCALISVSLCLIIPLPYKHTTA